MKSREQYQSFRFWRVISTLVKVFLQQRESNPSLDGSFELDDANKTFPNFLMLKDKIFDLKDLSKRVLLLADLVRLEDAEDEV